VIRPFQIGDLLLIHRLGRQATKLNAIQALLQPRSPTFAALGAILPGIGGKVHTYVLRQSRNTLAHTGFIQVQKRPGRPESDITLLAPALDTPWGHPAIWEKLLAHYAQEAARHSIARIYADVPDQPLLVNTFSQVGFKLYTRQTIWRLTHYHSSAAYTSADSNGSHILRAQTKLDEWELLKLYTRVTPEAVQHAEGVTPNDTPYRVKPLILDWWQSGQLTTFVLAEQDDIQGCLLIGRTAHGYWMRMLVDTQNPDTTHIHQLLRRGLNAINTNRDHRPIYIGVRSYHGGLNTILADYGFAPFSDRARLVRHVPAWVRQAVPRTVPKVENVGEAIPTSFVLPDVPVHAPKISQTPRRNRTGTNPNRPLHNSS